MGQLELALLRGIEELVGIRTDTEWTTVGCPAIVRLFVNKQREFAKFIMAASSHDEAVGALMNLHGAWERRKTKQDTEEKSLQEARHAVYVAI